MSSSTVTAAASSASSSEQEAVVETAKEQEQQNQKSANVVAGGGEEQKGEKESNAGFSLIVSGATGACARHAVVAAVNHAKFTRIVALSRNDIPLDEKLSTKFPGINLELAKKKLQVKAIDWEALTNEMQKKEPSSEALTKLVGDTFTGHTHALNAVATTRKDAGGPDGFIRVDKEYSAAFLELVKMKSSNTFEHLAQISAEGANANSWFLYMQVKGQADDKALQLFGGKDNNKKITILRPGLLDRDEKARTVESIAKVFVTACPAQKVGQAAIKDFVLRGVVAEGKATTADKCKILTGNTCLISFVDGQDPSCGSSSCSIQ